MLNNHFNEGVARLKEIYGPNPFAPQRSIQIWKACEDLTDSEFNRIIEHIIASFRQPPLPKDFYEAARAEKSRRIIFKEDEPYKIQCEECQDTGLMWITSDQSIATWCFCGCNEGLNQMILRGLALPRWDYNMKMTCKSRKFPIEAFKPKAVFDPKKPVDSLMERVTAWNKELKTAEQYWLSRLTTNQGA